MRAFKTIRLAGLVLLLLSLVKCSGDFSDGGSPGLRIQALVGNELIISNASGDQQNPHVINLPDKNLYFVVYEDWSSQTSGADIKGRFINPDGTFCGNEITITNAQGNQTLPRAAYRDKDLLQTPSGKDTILVAWQDTRGGANSGYVYFRSIDITNINLSDCSNISMGSENPVGYTPIQEYSGSTVTIVGPISQNIGTGDGTTKDFNGQLNNYPVVPGSITISVAGTPVCSDNGQGSFRGGCSGSISYESGLFSITFNTAPASGATVTASYKYYSSWPPGITSVNDQLLSRKSPKVVYDPVRDLFWITYIESRDTLNRISELCFGFVPVAWNFGDNSFVGYVGLKGADLNVSKGPEIIRNSTTRTTRLISSSHTALSETYEYEYFISANNPDIGVDTTSPEALLVFEGIRQKGELKCSCEDKNNNSVCDLADIVTSTFTTSNYDDGLVHIYGLFDKEIPRSVIHSKKIDSSPSKTSYPSIGFDPITKRFLVAWEDMRDGANTKIYGQLIYSGGDLYNQNFILSYQDADGNGQQDPQVANSKQTKPFVSYDSVNQRYFVVWQDGRNGPISLENLDIYGQSVDGEGSLRGSNYFISVAPANQWNPVVAYNSNSREFLAVWKDGRNYSSTGADIYGQRFTLGQPQLTLLKPDNTLLAPPLLNFGSIMKGQSTSLSFKIKNSGDATLKIDCFDPYPLGSPFAYEATLDINLQACNDNQYIEIIPGADQTFTVYFVPTNSGNFTESFTIKSDGGNSTISLQGQAGEPNITVSPASLDFGTVDVGLSKTLSLTISNKGNADLTVSSMTTETPFTISESPFTLQPGNSKTITVTFTPQSGGSFTKQLVIISNDPNKGSLTVNLTGTGNAVVTIRTESLPPGTVGGSYSATLEAQGGRPPYTWSIAEGSLPSGLTLAPQTGVISGTPSAIGTYNFTVKVTDADGRVATQGLYIKVYNPITITTAGLKPWTKDVEGYSETLQASGGDDNYTWSIVSGNLPNGLSLSGTQITGKPTLAGAYTFTLRVTDGTGAYQEKEYTIRINAPLQITTDSLPNGTKGVAYSLGINYTGGTAPYTWNATGLPGGLSIDEVTGVISGVPTQAGQSTVTITLRDVAGAQVQKIYTLKIYNPPDIDISPNTFSFGDVGIGLSKDIVVTMKNTGEAPLTVNTLQLNGSGFVLLNAPQTPFTLNQNASQIFTIRFQPSANVNYSGILTITSNDPDKRNLTYTLTGRGVNPPDIDVTPSLVDFGTVVAGQSKDITVTIKNNIQSGADLVISNITVSGNGYTLPTPPSYPITLSAGSTYQVTIRFTPPTSGQFSGSLTISSNDPDEGSFKVDLKGNGSVPPDISVSQASLDFGDVLLNQSKTLTLTISNIGGSDLQITNIQITGPGFSFKTQPQVPVTIQPRGNPVSIEVLFIPVNAQNYTGQITITSNDPDSSTTTIQLTGRGISAPNIEVTPASLDFGRVQINTTSDKTITIKNTGTEVLNISSITISGSQAFTIVSQSLTQIPAGEARNVTVRFSPTGELPYAGNLIISSDDPDTPSIQVPLTGEGTSQAGPGGGGGGENISSKGGGCSIGGAMNKPSQVANMVVLLLPLIFVGLRRFVKGIGGK